MPKKKVERSYTLEDIKNEFFPNRKHEFFENNHEADNNAIQRESMHDFLKRSTRTDSDNHTPSNNLTEK